VARPSARSPGQSDHRVEVGDLVRLSHGSGGPLGRVWRVVALADARGYDGRLLIELAEDVGPPV
jgi:hypothetical protein